VQGTEGGIGCTNGSQRVQQIAGRAGADTTTAHGRLILTVLGGRPAWRAALSLNFANFWTSSDDRRDARHRLAGLSMATLPEMMIGAISGEAT
jgi:hypothetical protein